VGKDNRFDRIRSNKFRFFTFWHIQGIWVFITTMPVHASNFFSFKNPEASQSWNVVDSLGLAVWAIGFAIEVIADFQKSIFRKQQECSKEPKWICSGLWA
jgi:steroid 5-alpha reductase family enzyme